MNNNDSVISIYSDARAEYMNELCSHLIPAYFQFFINCLTTIKKGVQDPKKVLWQFQTTISSIPEWNIDKVSQEIYLIQENCGCDYLEDLLTAVFIAHTKVLTAIRVSSKQKKVQITVPKVEHFLFRVLCESSKSIWRSVYLLSDNVSSIVQQQNYKHVEQLLHGAVQQAVRSMVPVKSILKDFVSQDDTDDDTKDNKDDNDIKSETADNDKCENGEESKNTDTPVSEVVGSEKVDKIIPPKVCEPVVALPQPDAIVVQPTIVVDTSNSTVEFSDFDTVYDTENPDNTDISFNPKLDECNNELKILDTVGKPLENEIQYEEL